MFGEGSELEGVEGVLPTSDVLHRVLSAAALAEEKRGQVRSLLLRPGRTFTCLAARLAASEDSCSAEKPRLTSTLRGTREGESSGSASRVSIPASRDEPSRDL